MAASNMDISSRITLANSSPSNRSYGSFNRSLESKGFIEHDVQPTDTLVGLSIKYNVSVEELMRFNRLWSKELLHLRDTIKIPLTNNQRAPAETNGKAITDSSSKDETTEPSEKVVINERKIDCILQTADEDLKKAIKFQQKLCSHRSDKASSYKGSYQGSYQGGYPEVEIKSQRQHIEHPQSGARIATSPLPEEKKQELEDLEDEMYQL